MKPKPPSRISANGQLGNDIVNGDLDWNGSQHQKRSAEGPRCQSASEQILARHTNKKCESEKLSNPWTILYCRSLDRAELLLHLPAASRHSPSYSHVSPPLRRALSGRESSRVKLPPRVARQLEHFTISRRVPLTFDFFLLT